jgi:hypothetical protein
MTGQGVRAIAGSIIVVTAFAGSARAWDAHGHQTVAAIAAKLIAGTNAESQVHAILGDTSLEDAAVWADCAKGVQRDPKTLVFSYRGAGSYPECKPFETVDGEAEMVDFVQRNWDTCKPKPGEEVCHKQYHYSDISIDHDAYKASYVGARADDVAMAIAATLEVLQGRAAPPPFSIKSKREALLLLVHYAGDIHQPLHVGAIYLDAQGRRVNPDKGTLDPATETQGGNSLVLSDGQKLHLGWDYIPPDLQADKVTATWIAKAKKTRATVGPVATWSLAWATDTQKQAQRAFKGLKFGPKTGTTWSSTLPPFDALESTVKKPQLTKGGARLAQVLTAIWPDGNVAAGGGDKTH